MRAKDKLQIVSNIQEQGMDMTRIMLSSLVLRVVRYANQKKLEPNDDPPENAVARFVIDSNKQPVAILNNGDTIRISNVMYRAEVPYNFLPTRYKTLVLS